MVNSKENFNFSLGVEGLRPVLKTPVRYPALPESGIFHISYFIFHISKLFHVIPDYNKGSNVFLLFFLIPLSVFVCFSKKRAFNLRVVNKQLMVQF